MTTLQRRRLRNVSSACLLMSLAACGDDIVIPPPPPPPPPGPSLEPVGSFTIPVYLTAPPGDTSRLFVVERLGRIRVVRGGTVLARAFLDLRGKIAAATTDEQGLFSLAFHPDYATNGRFYVFFTNLDGDIRVVRYNVSANPDSADEATADTVLAVPHPLLPGQTFTNHHGGQLQFGPDGMLYVSIGDGGCCGDPNDQAQDTFTLNGKVLRLDVNVTSGYAIPPDNPFVVLTPLPPLPSGEGERSSTLEGMPEIWAYGFRNPWRFSFDSETGDLYIADVGDGAWEEVSFAAAASGGGKGLNFGWSVLEGSYCFQTASCDRTGLVLPVIEYPHTGGACSVTGGYVYRGTRVPDLVGQYVYGDYCAGFVRGYRRSDGQAFDWTSRLSPGTGLVSFGQDARGELYVVQYGGAVYRIVVRP